MRAQRLGSVAVITGVLAAGLVTQAQTWKLARTPWGDPDFDGIWNYATMTALERPRDFSAKDTLSADEASAFEQQTRERRDNTNNTAGPDWWDPGTNLLSDRRTSLVTDPPTGRIPPLTPAAQKRAAARAQARRERGPADSAEDLALNERCLLWSTAGPPMLPGPYNNNVQFIQTPPFIVVVNEMIHDARIVPMDGRPHGTMRRWMGDSRGRWEGTTLVIDTINFTAKSAFRGSGEQLHLVERFTRTDANTIQYAFIVDDPETWTRPWTASFPLTKTNGPIFEYACHEGNERSMQGILLGARTQDKPEPRER
jgi:hypothetical protein